MRGAGTSDSMGAGVFLGQGVLRIWAWVRPKEGKTQTMRMAAARAPQESTRLGLFYGHWFFGAWWSNPLFLRKLMGMVHFIFGVKEEACYP